MVTGIPRGLCYQWLPRGGGALSTITLGHIVLPSQVFGSSLGVPLSLCPLSDLTALTVPVPMALNSSHAQEP